MADDSDADDSTTGSYVLVPVSRYPRRSVTRPTDSSVLRANSSDYQPEQSIGTICAKSVVSVSADSLLTRCGRFCRLPRSNRPRSGAAFRTIPLGSIGSRLSTDITTIHKAGREGYLGPSSCSGMTHRFSDCHRSDSFRRFLSELSLEPTMLLDKRCFGPNDASG